MKRKLTVLFVTVVMLFTMSLPLFAASGTAEKGTPMIDGIVDDIWSRTETYPIKNLKTDATTDVKSEFKMLWDDKYIYFIAIIIDPDIAYDAVDTYKKDGVQLYFDFTNQFASTYGEIFGGEYTIYLRDSEDELPTLSEINSAVSQEDIINDIVYAHKFTDNGYVLEARINPKLNYDKFKLAEGTEFAFDVQVNDQKKDSTERAAAYGWTDDADLAWQTPSVLGSIKLIETPVPVTEELAVIETPTETATETAPATADVSLLIYSMSVVSLAGSIIIFKKKK